MKQFNMNTTKIKDENNNWSSLPALKGESAYELAVRKGFEGSEDDFNNSLVKNEDIDKIGAQINKNTEDISLLLKKSIKNEIIDSASGSNIIIDDSSEQENLKSLKVFGWSKQESTTGAQLFPTITPSIEEKNGITVEHMEHGKIHISGTAEKTVDFIAPTFELLAGTYTLSMGVNIDNTLMRCTLSTTEGLPYFDILNNEASKAETTEDNMILYLLLRVYGGKTIDITIQPMLNTGTSPLPWEPYTGGQPSPSPKYPQQIVNAGANGEICIEVRGKNLFDNSADISKMQYYKLPIQMKKGAKLTMSFIGVGTGSGAVKAYCHDSELNYCNTLFYFDVKSGVNKYSSTITCSGREKNIFFYKTEFTKLFEKIYDIQIEINDVATDYTPYRESQSLSISTPTGLPAIPVDTDGNYTDANGQQWIADYIDLKRGKYVQWVYEKEIGEANWGVYGRMNGFYLMALPTIATGKSGISNQFKILKILGNEAGLILGINNSYIYSIQNPYYDETIGDKGLSNWKAHLTKHPLVVMTYLDEPIERDLTPEEIQAYKNLVTYAGTTIVENDAECYMELGYVADPKAYIDKKFSELSAAIVASASEAE